MSSEKSSGSLSGQPLSCTAKYFSMTVFESVHSLIDEVNHLRDAIGINSIFNPYYLQDEGKDYCDATAILSCTLRDTDHVAKPADTEQRLDYFPCMCLVLFILKQRLCKSVLHSRAREHF